MPVVISADQPTRPRGLVLWRVLTWLLLLVAALGCLLNLQHARRVWQQLQITAPTDASGLDALHGMLGWDVSYLLSAFVMIVICAGCILRQAWARPSMRVAAGLFAAGLVVIGFSQWRDLQMLGTNIATFQSHAQQQGALAAAQIAIGLQRGYRLALLLKALGVIVLLWLAWTLGKPAVKSQFRRRR